MNRGPQGFCDYMNIQHFGAPFQTALFPDRYPGKSRLVESGESSDVLYRTRRKLCLSVQTRGSGYIGLQESKQGQTGIAGRQLKLGRVTDLCYLPFGLIFMWRRRTKGGPHKRRKSEYKETAPIRVDNRQLSTSRDHHSNLRHPHSSEMCWHVPYYACVEST